ncbi:MAG: nucleoside triphosphate pyrophosphohydrolase [Bacteroidales bacterium]|nr:nucleoside triphosphate pyrophosphohydrolase [Bacteroidales bacterium]
MESNKINESFNRLLDTIKVLRKKCPWDAALTNEQLRTLTIEEVYELSQSIMDNNTNDRKKEIGDVLLHIIIYALIAEEKGEFALTDVFDTLNEKLVFRHPHIFGDAKAETPEEVSKLWEQVKLKEKGGNKTVLGGIPRALPSIIKAYRMQDKASHAGFDWEQKGDVWPKVYEEMGELKVELDKGDQDNSEAEFGDLLFAVINAGRLYNINPDTALERTNAKFASRFNHIEARAKEKGLNLKDMTLQQMEDLWNEAKAIEKQGK